MPVLPSGLTLGIGYQAIPEQMPDNWFSCPEGHFWYYAPDERISPPPYDVNSSYLQDCIHAPVPKSTEEMKKYLYVLYLQSDGIFLWRGEWLDRFPLPNQLSHEDLVAWNSWLESDATIAFLEGAIHRCKIQAILNEGASDFGIAYTASGV